MKLSFEGFNGLSQRGEQLIWLRGHFCKAAFCGGYAF